jgi:hypothetical protein
VRAVVAALVVLPALAASAAPTPPAPSPRGAKALTAALRDAEARLGRLVALAKVDPRIDEIRAYLAYGNMEWAATKRPVTVERLLAIATDPAAPPEIREQAAAALGSTNAKQSDPDLSTDGKGARRPRAAFSLKVANFLVADEVMSRGLASKILFALWPGANDAAMFQYDARREKTWKPARKSWQDYLRK